MLLSRLTSFTFFMLLLIAIELIPTPLLAASWQHIESGLEYKFFTVKYGDAGQARIHALEIDPNKLSLVPVFNKKNTSAKNLAIKNNALAVINANFFDEFGNVLGLLLKDGTVINPPKKISWWSVLCINNRNVSIIHTNDYKNGFCKQAIQTGPRLVVGGGTPKLKDESSRKTAVGIKSNGKIILVVSEDEMPIKELAKVFQKKDKDDGLECVNALNLDGGSSSQLYVKTPTFSLNISSYMKVPVGLAVLKK